jgi:hypothetical protein
MVFHLSNLSRVKYKDFKKILVDPKLVEIFQPFAVLRILQTRREHFLKLKTTKEQNLKFVHRRPVYDRPFDFLEILSL